MIGGQRRPVHYGYWALAKFGEKTGVTLLGLMDLVSSLSFSSLITLIHTGLQDGGRIDKTPFTETEHEVADWLDARPEARQEFIDFFSECLVKIFPTEDDEKTLEGNVKSLPGTVSKK